MLITFDFVWNSLSKVSNHYGKTLPALREAGGQCEHQSHIRPSSGKIYSWQWSVSSLMCRAAKYWASSSRQSIAVTPFQSGIGQPQTLTSFKSWKCLSSRISRCRRACTWSMKTSRRPWQLPSETLASSITTTVRTTTITAINNEAVLAGVSVGAAADLITTRTAEARPVVRTRLVASVGAMNRLKSHLSELVVAVVVVAYPSVNWTAS